MIATVAKTTTLWRLSSSCICPYHYNGDGWTDNTVSPGKASTVYRSVGARQLHPLCHARRRRPTAYSWLVCMHCQRRRTIHNARRPTAATTTGQTDGRRVPTHTQTREAHTSSRRLRGRHTAQTVCKLPTACPQLTCEPDVISRHNSGTSVFVVHHHSALTSSSLSC